MEGKALPDRITFCWLALLVAVPALGAPSSRIVVAMTSALRAPDTPSDIFVERDYFLAPYSRRSAGKPMFTASRKSARAKLNFSWSEHAASTPASSPLGAARRSTKR
jgi:hypothetical protein